jgi:hypothetical protein
LLGPGDALAGARSRRYNDGHAQDENIDVSSNGASPKGFTRFGFIDDEDRRFVEAQHAAFRELGKELEAEGVDSTEEYEKLLARAATWSSAPS